MKSAALPAADDRDPNGLLATNARSEHIPPTRAGTVHRYGGTMTDLRSGRPALRPRVTASQSPRAASRHFPVRQHVMDTRVRLLRPTDGRGSCHGGTRESRGRHASACADGSRGSSRAAVVRLEGALAHSGLQECLLSQYETDVGRRLAVTVRPRELATLSAPLHDHQSAIFAHRRQAASSHRQLDLVTVRAARHPVKPAPWHRDQPLPDTLCTACGTTT